MGFFGSSKPNVSANEFRKTLGSLYSRGFSKAEVNEVEKVFYGDLNETDYNQQGIDQTEISNRLQWLRSNPGKHRLQQGHIDELEKVLKEKL